MNAPKLLGESRLILLCYAACAVSACGQQEQATTESVDKGAAAEMTRTEKVPVTTSSD